MAHTQRHTDSEERRKRERKRGAHCERGVQGERKGVETEGGGRDGHANRAGGEREGGTDI